MTAPVLEMRDVGVRLGRGMVLDGLTLTVAAGAMVALVGESGSGKTMAALSVPRLLPQGALLSGSIAVLGTEMAALPDRAMRRWRGGAIGMVFQDQDAALHPAKRIGAQIAEAVRLHAVSGQRAAWRMAESLLGEVGMPPGRARDYPARLSGGQRQRAAIAMALAGAPRLLIADECTAGLDPVAARQIMDLLGRLRRERGLAILFVTHDLALARLHADAVHVLYAGRTAETGPAGAVLSQPAHPYTAALLGGAARQVPLPEPGLRPDACLFAPRCPLAERVCLDGQPPLAVWGAQEAACRFPGRAAVTGAEGPARHAAPGATILRVTGLAVRYGGMEALRIDDLTVAEGECVAVVGASGSGKTTLARAVLQMRAYDGEIVLRGQTLATPPGRARRAALQDLSAVFQDPAGSLNPAMTVGAIVAEPLVLRGLRDEGRVRAMLDRLGLPEALMTRYPATLSGGQAQRVALARALITDPALLVLDEPASSLDAPAAAALMRLLRGIMASRAMGSLFITHDLRAAAFLAHRIAVLDRGRMVEIGDAGTLLRKPAHPASQHLVAASEI